MGEKSNRNILKKNLLKKIRFVLFILILFNLQMLLAAESELDSAINDLEM